MHETVTALLDTSIIAALALYHAGSRDDRTNSRRGRDTPLFTVRSCTPRIATRRGVQPVSVWHRLSDGKLTIAGEADRGENPAAGQAGGLGRSRAGGVLRLTAYEPHGGAERLHGGGGCWALPRGAKQRGSRKSLVPASQMSLRWTWQCTTWRGHWTVTTPACPTMALTR